MNDSNNGNPEASWSRYRELVMRELERLDGRIGSTSDSVKAEIAATEKRISKRLEGLETTQRTIDRDVVALKVKAGVWGVIGGAIPSIVALAFMYFKKGG